MNPKSFRIGNLVEYDNRIFEIYTVADEFPTLNTTEFGIGVVDWNNIKPIKPTGELLVKLGFEKKTYGETDFYTLQLNDLYFYMNSANNILGLVVGEIECECGCTIEDIDIVEKIDYIHELQNLHFALSGKELEF